MLRSAHLSICLSRDLVWKTTQVRAMVTTEGETPCWKSNPLVNGSDRNGLGWGYRFVAIGATSCVNHFVNPRAARLSLRQATCRSAIRERSTSAFCRLRRATSEKTKRRGATAVDSVVV